MTHVTHLKEADRRRARRSLVILALTVGGWALAVASRPEIIDAALRML